MIRRTMNGAVGHMSSSYVRKHQRMPFTTGTSKRPCLARYSSADFHLPPARSASRVLCSYCLICRVTSAPRAGPLDVTLGDWAQAGLARPSVARLDRLVTAEKTILGRRLGMLSAADQATIRRAWNQRMRL